MPLDAENQQIKIIYNNVFLAQSQIQPFRQETWKITEPDPLSDWPKAGCSKPSPSTKMTWNLS